MIEIRKNTDPEVKKRGLLFVDGVLLENAFVDTHRDSPNSCSVTSKDAVTSLKIVAHTFSDFPLTPDYIDLWFYPIDLEHLDKRGLFICQWHNKQDEKVLLISFKLGGDTLTQWQSSYTFADYVYAMCSVLNEHEAVYEADWYGNEDQSISYQLEIKEGSARPQRNKISLNDIDKSNIHSLSVSFTCSPHKLIAEEIEHCSAIIREVHEEVLSRLISRISNRSVVTSFKDFPKEVRTYCEQYLMYFIQFLQDLGVDATSEIKHEAGKVLFTVTPDNEHEALDKIRTALNVYLHLPSNPIGNNPSTDIAVNRLESTVFRLHSDLRLAAAELQAKNATIEAQQLTINVQRSLLSGEILPLKQNEDREEFLDGAVALTVLKKEGVELNLAKIYRVLKDMFIEK